eukprot:CAMPEP_0204559286 /NCGR_PEP_ID=MMETSP0661-20131031/31807_1 /ASSEMBLY_ACC=CAM_ASM_000606 /TAXON_ID=109239 /ORGANISM="Alexandrium margalefi, Strain AMGDE01CS-322" /LENGTH=32 /DNA_ID= /DNA_START= /DNA_END= /DNA_ORIENTATION=
MAHSARGRYLRLVASRVDGGDEGRAAAYTGLA